MFINIQLFAHKKGGGSTKNGRDSIAKRLGVKKSDGSPVVAGNIIVRQRGSKIHPDASLILSEPLSQHVRVDPSLFLFFS